MILLMIYSENKTFKKFLLLLYIAHLIEVNFDLQFFS